MTQIRYRSAAKLALVFSAFLLAATARSAPSVLLNPNNESNVDEGYIRALLTGTERFWENGTEVLIAVLKDDPQSDKAINQYSGMTPSKFKNHWQRIAFSGRGKMPKQFSTKEKLLEFVNRTPGAIAIIDDKGNS